MMFFLLGLMLRYLRYLKIAVVHSLLYFAYTCIGTYLLRMGGIYLAEWIIM